MPACKHEHLYDTDVIGYSTETNDTPFIHSSCQRQCKNSFTRKLFRLEVNQIAVDYHRKTFWLVGQFVKTNKNLI